MLYLIPLWNNAKTFHSKARGKLGAIASLTGQFEGQLLAGGGTEVVGGAAAIVAGVAAVYRLQRQGVAGYYDAARTSRS